MKKLILAALAAVSLFSPSQARADSLGWIDRLGIALLAQQFRVDPAVVLGAYNTAYIPVYDSAPAYAIYDHTRVAPSKIFVLRRSGLPWSQVAQRLGMAPTVVQTYQTRGWFDSNRVWYAVIRDQCNMPEARIHEFRQRGMRWSDLTGVAYVAKHTRKDPRVVYSTYRVRRDWPRTLVLYKVSNRLQGVPTVVRVPVRTLNHGQRVSAYARTHAKGYSSKAPGHNKTTSHANVKSKSVVHMKSGKTLSASTKSHAKIKVAPKKKGKDGH